MAKDIGSFKNKAIPDLNKKRNGKEYIDIDQTILEPSPQRIRNILTLEERVAAIQAYDCRPMYTKVAKMFNCSWEQIKNIIANRDAIMEFYMATKSAETQNDPNRLEVRSRKIRFLGECLYEYIQRAQFHTKANVTEELLRMKAIEFRDIIQIDNFMPNKAWINHFKATYNFSLSNRQITITRTPPTSLDLKDIMTYCTKNRAKLDAVNQSTTPNDGESDLYRTATRIAISDENEATLQEVKQRRFRKISFLTKALFEYWKRAKFHHKLRMNESSLRKVAFELKEMLKIDSFYPDKEWLNHYITITYPALLKQASGSRPPPLSLDLKDILSYCSRQENKKQLPSTITLAPKETTKLWNGLNADKHTPPTAPLVQIHTFNLRRSNEAVTQRTQIPAPLPKAAAAVAMAAAAEAEAHAATTNKIKEEVIELDADDDDDEPDVKPDLNELVPQQTSAGPQTTITNVRSTTKGRRSGNSVIDGDKDSQPPALKIQKIESISVQNEQPMHSPGHWSEHSEQGDELPRHVTNYRDALKLLKPLEEFAMLEENYRVIGLISQLEDIFKHPPKKDEEN